MKAYLDIETSFEGAITVVGLYAADRGLVQLIGTKISDVAVRQALEGVETISEGDGLYRKMHIVPAQLLAPGAGGGAGQRKRRRRRRRVPGAC